MPYSLRKTPLSEARRNIVIAGLADGKSKREIGQQINTHERTVREWIRTDPSLKEAANDLLRDVYEKSIERLYGNALVDVKPTAETQHKAMMEIIKRYEEARRREAGEMTMNGVHLVLMRICAVLRDMPEAKRKVIDAYRNAREAEGLGSVGPGDGSSGSIDYDVPDA